jgi:choline dehydrogenase-like flavoprotein
LTETSRPTDWSDGQLATLAEIFSAIVEPAYAGESRRHAELAAAALSEVADPADLRQVRLVVTLLGTRLGSLLVAQRRRRDLGQLLEAWSTSPLPQRRSFFQLVKRLACFFAYADPGPAGANPRWPLMCYAFPDEPIVETRPVERALIKVDAQATESLMLETDVVVVGSGAGGGLIAARLAEAGRDVLVVEAGRYLAEGDFPRNELDGFTQLYLDRGLTASADLFGVLAGAAVGGGTLINWTTSIEPPDSDRSDWAQRFGLDGFDGPATDAHAARLREELGFCSPPNIPPKDQLILSGASGLGWEAAPTQRNAADCGDCGGCSFGCRRGEKRSGQRLHLALAAGHGARLLAGARVARVLVDAGAASGVTGIVAGRAFRVQARTVVVAAGAVRTPALLLRSGITHPVVGANLYLHPTAVITAQMPHDVQIWRGTTQAVRSLELVQRGVVIESAPAHPGLIAVATPWHGRAQLAAQMAGAGRDAPLIGIVRDRDAGRVRLTRSGRPRIDYRISDHDASTARVGLVAMAHIARAAGAGRIMALGTPGETYEPAAGSDRSFERFLARLDRFDFAPNRGTLFSAHQMGTARAGSDPRTTACDPYGQVRSDKRGGLIRGLYVGDASLFPSAVGINPMVTVMLMAARVAEGIAADRGS